MNKPNPTDDVPQDRIGSVEWLKGTLVLLIIVSGSLLSYLKNTTLFPFDTYSMYSYLHTEDFQYPRMYGLPTDADGMDKAAEIDISDQKFWGFQMHIGRKIIATTRLLNRSDANSEEVKTALAFLRDLYNRRQQASLHDGPPIKRLRMYKFAWKLRSDLSTLEAPYQRTVMGRVTSCGIAMKSKLTGAQKNFYFAPGSSLSLGVNRFLICAWVLYVYYVYRGHQASFWGWSPGGVLDAPHTHIAGFRFPDCPRSA